MSTSRHRRGTGGPGGTPLAEYGRPGTFGLAVAQKLAASGITEAELVQLAQERGKTKWLPFRRYIDYFKEEGFKIVLENGRYVDKTGPSQSTGASTPMQIVINGQIPTKDDFESAYRMLARPGQSISIDAVLDQIETNTRNKILTLQNNWRMITEENIKIWSKKL